ncbi:solute carrier family 35 member F2-like [Rhopilema esculentum]|uniref:solute carrier family 35 member F2-like n=1 Tax=Rhopilema esculentum TaxID=499914 RepID=UPI0031D10876
MPEMGLLGKEEKTALCTVRNFVNQKGHLVTNGGLSYHTLDETDCEINTNISKSTSLQNGGFATQNGGLTVQNGGHRIPNGNAKIQNGGLHTKENCQKLTDERKHEHDSVEIDFSTSSLIQSGSEAVVECTKDKSTLLKTIICGQILSLTLCGVGTSSAALAKWYDVRVPGFQAFLTYTTLALTAGTKLAFDSNKFKEILKERGWKYLILGLADVEANYLLVKAYTFTTLTSAQLCDSFTIPTVLILSCLILRVRYKASHYIGVVLCVAGAVCLIFTDTRDTQQNAKNELLGDFLSLSGAFLYGCSNVAQEFIVRSFTKTEFLGMIGIICALISGIQTIAVERDVIYNIEWSWHVILLIASFVICQYLYYTLMPWVITLSSATVVNLSLLTSDLYTLMFGLFLFGYKFSYLYFVAFGGIFIGLIIYNWKPTPVSPRRTRRAKEDIKRLETDTNLVFSEKKKLCEKEEKVGIYSFTKYSEGNANGLKNTQV